MEYAEIPRLEIGGIELIYNELDQLINGLADLGFLETICSRARLMYCTS